MGRYLVFDVGCIEWGESSGVVGMHPDTIRAWADEGKIPCWRTPGGQRRFRRSDLLALLPANPTDTLGGDAA